MTTETLAAIAPALPHCHHPNPPVRTAMLMPAPEDQSLSPPWLYLLPPAGEDLWIFAYGSLMWNPGFSAAAAAPALLKG
ncbi:gamma-glutamylcyclotransferase, partial [Salmonella enterica]|uniref:gamma-glutamylcyclotransferase n=1 Tax=Salmonella enterica TaxID=28901 RepID=UPI003D2DB155